MEIMVCLVVMSVVVIGASGLLLQSGRLARSSAQMAQASVLASELTAMLRQRVRIGSALAWPAWAQQLDFQLAQRASGSTGPDCRLQLCDPEQSLEFELRDWSLRASAVLPAARLVVCRDRSPWNAGAAQLDWTCSGGATAPLLLKLGWKPSTQERQATPRPLLVMAIE